MRVSDFENFSYLSVFHCRSPKPTIKKKKTSDSNECIDVNSSAAKKIKEKFRLDISGDIVRHLKPYFSKTCTVGQIQSSDDFRHLARKVKYSNDLTKKAQLKL